MEREIEYVVRHLAGADRNTAAEEEQTYCFSSADHLNYKKKKLLDEVGEREWLKEDLFTENPENFFSLGLSQTLNCIFLQNLKLTFKLHSC